MFNVLLSSNHKGENLKLRDNGSARILQKSIANEFRMIKREEPNILTNFQTN